MVAALGSGRSKNGSDPPGTSRTFQLQNPRRLAKMETVLRAIPSRVRTRDRRRRETSQHASLLHRRGGRRRVNSASITADGRAVYNFVIAKFDGFFRVRRNIIFERARFNRRNQLEGESSEQYIMELYKLSESCEYGDFKDEMIRDRLVAGIRDAALSQQLQLDAELTLDKTTKRIRQREAVSEQQQELKRAPERATTATSLDDVHRRPFKGKNSQMRKNEGREIGRGSTKPTKPCGRCGRGSHPRDKCPAKDATCHRCGKKGHFSSQCFTKQVADIKSEMEAAFLGTVTDKQASAWYTSVQLN